MERTKTRLLLIDDDEDSGALIQELLNELPGQPHQLATATDYASGLHALAITLPDLCLLDIHLGPANGLDLIGEAHARDLDVPFLVLSGSTPGRSTGLAAIQAGAGDYLSKHGMTAAWLDRAIRYAIERHRLLRSVRAQHEAIEASEHRLRTVVEHSLDSLVVVDDDGAVQFANPEAERAWAGSIDGLIAMLSRGPGTTLGSAEITVAQPGAAARVAEVRSAAVEWEGRQARLLSIRDITLHRALELQLRQSQKMEAMGHLTGGLAHDLNNILTVILANTDLLRERVGEEGREDLRSIDLAANRGAELIRKLLAFGRRQHLDCRVVHPVAVIGEFVAMARRLLPESIDLQIETTPDIPDILVDPTALEQILLNLATNARDAMPLGGRLVLRLEPITIEHAGRGPVVSAPPGRYLAIAMTDTGSGMNPDVQERIFEPFFSTKPEGEGTGLGMAMVFGLVAQHQGFIGVSSAPRAGTTITILLPTALHQAGAVPVDLPERLSGGSETILYVEDEPELRRAACRVLRRFGYTVLEAGDGEEGLAVWRAHRGEIALVISDVVMPRGSGEALRAALRTAGETVPFLFNSGYTAQHLRLPVDGSEPPLLHKPWSIAELVSAVRQALDLAPGAPE